jgi:hypothetical protein
MTTLTVSAAELVRIVRAVERSAAKDDSRPVLAGIHVAATDGTLAATAADGFRLSMAYAMLTEDAPEPVAPAILDRAALLAFVKTIKPKLHPTVSIEPSAESWTFAHHGSRGHERPVASVPTIAGTYPDFRQIIGDGAEPVLFAINPRYLADVLTVHGADVVHVSRATDSLSSPLFFTAGDGTRHVVMPMVADTQPERPGSASAPAKATPATDTADAEPAPVTPEESAIRSIRAARERVAVKRAARRAAPSGAPEPITSPAISCPECGEDVTEADRYCGSCGVALSARAADLSAYSEANQRRILAQCPHASDVRGFRAWLDAGRVVRKGEKGIRINAPITATVDGAQKVVRIKPTHVFDISQTDALSQEAAA